LRIEWDWCIEALKTAACLVMGAFNPQWWSIPVCIISHHISGFWFLASL
jgi:hypothetical protein